MHDHIKANSIFQFPRSLEMKLSRRCKEYCEVKKESFGQVRSPQDLSYVRSPEDLSVGLSIKERKVQGPEDSYP